jgi:hypothetical protein
MKRRDFIKTALSSPVLASLPMTDVSTANESDYEIPDYACISLIKETYKIVERERIKEFMRFGKIYEKFYDRYNAFFNLPRHYEPLGCIETRDPKEIKVLAYWAVPFEAAPASVKRLRDSYDPTEGIRKHPDLVEHAVTFCPASWRFKSKPCPFALAIEEKLTCWAEQNTVSGNWLYEASKENSPLFKTNKTFIIK